MLGTSRLSVSLQQERIFRWADTRNSTSKMRSHRSHAAVFPGKQEPPQVGLLDPLRGIDHPIKISCKPGHDTRIILVGGLATLHGLGALEEGPRSNQVRYRHRQSASWRGAKHSRPAVSRSEAGIFLRA